MNMMSKKMLIPMAAVAIIGAGAYGATKASADSSSSNPRDTLIQKLADKFKVDKSEVKAVFDEDMKARQADREADYEAKLTQAVKDGKLTSAQKDLVLAEHKKLADKMRAEMENTSATREEHRDAMEKIRTEATDWAKANNIDAKWLIGPGGPGHMRGMGPGMGRGMGHGMMGDHDRDDATPTASPSAQ